VIFVSVGVPQNQTPEKTARVREGARPRRRAGVRPRFKGHPAYKATHTSYVVVVGAAGKVVYTGSGVDQDLDAAISKAFHM